MGSCAPVDSPRVAYETDVLVCGGGPVGMLMAYQLGRAGISCMMVEQGTRTSAHPKMEFLTPRSMEIFRSIGLSERLRAIAVPEHHDFDEIFSTGLSRKDGALKTLKRPSPEAMRDMWRKENDGSHALEPYKRVSQIIVEAWLKPLCEADPHIDDRWGWCFNSFVEKDDHVLSTVTDAWGKQVLIKSKYVVGCDGAGSKVRAAAGLEAKRKPMPMNMYMLHFRSYDLETLYSQGNFWHLNLLTGSIIVNQDEVAIFTFHTMVPPDVDLASLDPMTVLQNGLGGIGEPCAINVDKILKIGGWKSSLSIADTFRSEKGCAFLAGDAAHQLTPAGGLGLNSGISDTFDLTWKLAAVLRGYGGEQLLRSYDHERRPVAKHNVQRVEEAMSFFMPMLGYAAQVGHDVIHAQDESGEKARHELGEMIEKAHWIHSQEGTWIDYRYKHSPINLSDPTGSEPERVVTKYVPSTWPGSRAPHVYLSDGYTSIFDLYGSDYSIVDFTEHGEVSQLFLAVARGMNIPVKRISLPSEKHVRSVWQRDAVLVRPDGHVAWRCRADGVESVSIADVRNILAISTGRKCSPDYQLLPELQNEMFLEVAPEERIQGENEMLVEVKTGRNEQLEDSAAVAKEAQAEPSGLIAQLKNGLAAVSVAEVQNSGSVTPDGPVPELGNGA